MNEKLNIKILENGIEKKLTQDERDNIINFHQVTLLQLSNDLINEFDDVPVFNVVIDLSKSIYCKIPEYNNIIKEYKFPQSNT